MCFSFHAILFFLMIRRPPRSTLFKLRTPFLCATPSPALGHHVTPLPMLSPLVSTQWLQHSPKAVQNIMTQPIYEHVNNCFFTYRYTTTDIISSMQSLTDHCPKNELVNSSHSGVGPAFKSCNICVLKTVFSFRFLPCSNKCSALSTYTSLSNKSPWSSKGLATHYAYSAWCGTQSNAPKPCTSNPKY
jgi:hypothetical protein